MLCIYGSLQELPPLRAELMMTNDAEVRLVGRDIRAVLEQVRDLEIQVQSPCFDTTE